MSVAAVAHPCPFPSYLMDEFAKIVNAEWLETGRTLHALDPFAGIGRIHELADMCGHQRVITYGAEIEPEWAWQHDRTICADSRDLPWDDASMDMVVTSPAYGNRMADQYLPPESDKSRRYTYTTALGRRCAEGSGAGMQWGEQYAELHAAVWAECVRLLAVGGLVVLNMKDHVRGGEVQPVTDWHHETLTALGLSHERTVVLDGREGIKHSPNRARCAEQIRTFRKVAAGES